MRNVKFIKGINAPRTSPCPDMHVEFEEGLPFNTFQFRVNDSSGMPKAIITLDERATEELLEFLMYHRGWVIRTVD